MAGAAKAIIWRLVTGLLLLVAIAGTRVEATIMDGTAAGDATRPDGAMAASRARAGSRGLL